MAWMRELRPSAAGVGDPMGEVGEQAGSWRLRVCAASMIGRNREWVAQKYQLRSG